MSEWHERIHRAEKRQAELEADHDRHERIARTIVALTVFIWIVGLASVALGVGLIGWQPWTTLSVLCMAGSGVALLVNRNDLRDARARRVESRQAMAEFRDAVRDVERTKGLLP